MTGQILGTGLIYLDDGRTSCLAVTPSASHYLFLTCSHCDAIKEYLL